MAEVESTDSIIMPLEGDSTPAAIDSTSVVEAIPVDPFSFPPLLEKTEAIVCDALSKVLANKGYEQSKVSAWIDEASNAVLDALMEMSTNFKYVVFVTIVQKVGAGVHSESAGQWEPERDGCTTVKFESESLLALCHVGGIAL